MNNELITVEDNNLAFSKEGVKFIKKIQKMKLDLNILEEQLKDTCLKKMEETGQDKLITPDGSFKATYYKATKSKRFDSKKFKTEHPDMYEEYQTESERKAYVRFS